MVHVHYTSDRAREIARAHSRGPNAAAIEALKDDRRIGLSVVHTSPRVYATVAPRGSYLAVREVGGRPPRNMPTRRGAVHGFSRRSRSRMIQLCSQIDRAEHARALMVTLTYPATWSGDFTTWKRHLDSFGKRLVRRFPRISFIWKLEFQKRGAPHFHLLVWGQRFIPASMVSNSWYEVVGSLDERHARSGTEVRRVRNARQAVSYAAKYLGKVESTGDPDAHTGRIWGVVGRRCLPIHLVEWRLDESGASRVLGMVRQLLRSRGFRFDAEHPPPRWVIMDGQRALGFLRYVDGLAAAADPLS